MANGLAPKYVPTLEQIKAGCAKEQENWTEEEELKRRYKVNNYGKGKDRYGDQCVPDPMSVPVVNCRLRSSDYIEGD